MNIVIVGLGYVGLSNAVLLAQKNNVIGVDISHEKVAAINAGMCPIVDNDLEKFLRDEDLNLYAQVDDEGVYDHAEHVIIAIPTNYNEQTNFFDTSSLERVIEKFSKIFLSLVFDDAKNLPHSFQSQST